MSKFKEGDVVVILEAYPEKHNGKVSIVRFCYNFGNIEVFIPEVGHSWECKEVRLATLLERELYEL